MRAVLVIAFAAAISLTSGQSEGEPCIDGQCDEGFSCHPNQDICYKDVEPTPKLHVWLGTGPNKCNRQASDCELFYMDFDVTHVHGGEDEWCNNGEKVRCVVRDVSPLTTTPDNELRVVAYNVFERGWYVSLDGQRERTCRIPSVMAEMYPDVDVITFQENFMGGCWSRKVSMRDLLTHAGFPYHTKTISHPHKVENGGIYIASRWPILEEDQYIFKSTNPLSWDFFAAKGVSYAKIQKGAKIYHVMGTHFQAGRDEIAIAVRRNQSLEWAEYVTQKNFPVDEGVVYSGDINADYWDGPGSLFYEIMDNLQASMPKLVGAYNASTSPLYNDLQRLRGETGWGRFIDHVIYSNRHLMPKEALVEVLIPEDKKPFPVCWCEECINPIRLSYTYATPEDCAHDLEYLKSLSDHQAVLGIFTF